MNNEQRLQQLEKQVQDLVKWKNDKTKQQISYPLDLASIEALNKYFLRIVSSFIQVGGVAGRAFRYFFVKQDQFIGSFPEDLSAIFTVDAGTDVLTVTAHSFANDDRVYVFTSDTLPSPLDSTTTYYVISSTGTTFKLSTSLGGGAVNITNAGTGIHYINYL